MEIGNKFEQLVCEQDGDGMTGLQLLSCNPGAFQHDDGRGLLKQIVNTGWYYQALSCHCIRVNSCISFLNIRHILIIHIRKLFIEN